MATVPSSYLQSNGTLILRDSQTAARLFVDDGFRLAPKHSFLFHVAFNINPAAVKTQELIDRHRNEIGMLVKSVDLPSFEIQSDDLNQYNRHKVAQYRHKFNAININFHDDNMGLINQMWQNYYAYYYTDSTAAQDKANYQRNATRNYSTIRSTYGLDNNSTFPFFNYISIYQMARHEYVGYKLINPIITKWNHNKLDYSVGNKTHENSMTISFESVAYSNGSVTQGDPEGFAQEHYDQTPSPLTNPGGLTSASPTFAGADLQNYLEALKNVAETLQQYQSKTIESSPNNISTVTQGNIVGTGGLQDIAFPVANNSNNTVPATQVILR